MYWRLLTSRQHGYYYFHWLSSWTSMPLLSTGVRDVKLVGILQSRKTVNIDRRQRCLIISHPSVSEDRGFRAALDSSFILQFLLGLERPTREWHPCCICCFCRWYLPCLPPSVLPVFLRLLGYLPHFAPPLLTPSCSWGFPSALM